LHLLFKQQWQTPAPVVDDYIEIPKELTDAQHDVTLCLDGMKINGLPFLTTISKNIYYRTAQYITRQNAETYKEAISEVIRIYNRAALRVTEIRSDNEFRPMSGDFAHGFGVHMNYANPNEHVPEAERNNRVIKERIRATYHRLPFTHLPRLMVKMLVSESAKKLNFFPAKHGISKYYSPRMILHQKNLDYEKHLKYAFGTYVQAHDDPESKNNNAPRTLDCIYLRYSDAHQGGHELLHLQTNQLLRCQFVTPLPITPAIIKQVHALAEQDRMPKGLKITNRTGQILFDSAWLAGVDYDEEEFDNEDFSEDENESDDDTTPSDNEYDEMHPDD
jgi:hypothetical protein